MDETLNIAFLCESKELAVYVQKSCMPLHPFPSEQSQNFPTQHKAMDYVVQAQPGETVALQLILIPHIDLVLKTVLLKEGAGILSVPALGGVDRFGYAFSKEKCLPKSIATPVWVLLDLPYEIKEEVQQKLELHFEKYRSEKADIVDDGDLLIRVPVGGRVSVLFFFRRVGCTNCKI